MPPQDAGFTEPFSAHQLLYPGEEDTRGLLLDLLSMLPPDGVRCTHFVIITYHFVGMNYCAV